MSSVKVTQATFKDVVVDNSKPVLVDFWATWCPPCKKLGPILEEISDEMPEVVIAKVDVDQERTLGSMFQIMSIPTMLIFKDGKKVAEFVGLRPKSEIVAELNKHI